MWAKIAYGWVAASVFGLFGRLTGGAPVVESAKSMAIVAFILIYTMSKKNGK